MSGFFNEYPYTDFHELNLDWVIDDNKKVHDEMEETVNYINTSKTYIDGKLQDATTQAQNSANSALQAKGYKEEIQDDVNQIARNSADIETLNNRVDEIVSLPSGSTQGDAELMDIRVGENDITYSSAGNSVRGQFEEIRAYNLINLVDNMNIDTLSYYGITYTWSANKCTVTGTSTALSFDNIFLDASALPDGMKAGEDYTIHYDATNVKLEIYDYSGGSVRSTIAIILHDDVITIPKTTTGMLIRLRVDAGVTCNETIQPMIIPGGDIAPTYYRAKRAIINDGVIGLNMVSSCNDLKKDIFFVNYYQSGSAIPDFPLHNAGWIQTIETTSNVKIQLVYPYQTTDSVQYRVKQGANWTNWKSLGVYQGYIDAIDIDSPDETGKTDMTAVIQSMLNNVGYCKLGVGCFYVSGNINIPSDATLEGCGNKTTLRLLSTTTNGYIAKINSRSTIKNLRFSGSYDNIDIDDEVGNRKGLVLTSANYTSEISQCYFDNLDSAIYMNNTGGNVVNGMIFSDCYINNCEVAINIDYKSEYHKFTNMCVTNCYIACVNNGGNNVFMGCTFHGIIGFVIDNSSGTKTNNGHGSAIGCTFNHIDSATHPETLGNGLGIKVVDASNGFLFNDCQLWYGKIYIDNSDGISINNCLIGGASDTGKKPTIITSGTKKIFVNGCIFNVSPDLTDDNAPTIYNNCYTFDGAEVGE